MTSLEYYKIIILIVGTVVWAVSTHLLEKRIEMIK